MPVLLPSTAGWPKGLDGFLKILIAAVNGLEDEVRGRRTAEELLRGRTDAVARDLRAQIATERANSDAVIAGLRSRLDEFAAERMSERAAAELLREGLDRIVRDLVRGNVQSIANAALQFPVILGGDALRTLTSTSWTHFPGTERVTIARPGPGVSAVLELRNVYVTSTIVTGFVRFRDLSLPSGIEHRITETGRGVRMSFPVTFSSGRKDYAIEGRVVRRSSTLTRQGIKIGAAILRAEEAAQT